MVTKKISVRGRVQGVFFRAGTKEKAEALNLKGFVRNESDGSVYIEASGDEKAMEEFISWCHHGPSAANVESVHTEDADPVSMKYFKIQR